MVGENSSQESFTGQMRDSLALGDSFAYIAPTWPYLNSGPSTRLSSFRATFRGVSKENDCHNKCTE